MDFAIFAAAAVLAMFLLFLAIGKWYPGSGADVLDWKPTRSYEDEIQLEMDDVEQMLEAQNERRRRTGRKELTEDEIRADVDREQREQNERAARYREDTGKEPGLS